MTKLSLFGGDPSMSHFTCAPAYRGKDEDFKAAQERRTAQYKALKALGWKEQYFQFKNADEKAKAAARKAAEKSAARWKKAAGFALEVNEGCFL
jgi:hypothetical protein